MKWKIKGEESHYKLQGAYKQQVELTLFPAKLEQAGHVIVLALYQHQLLFTRHKTRGFEWPGGKVEQGESPLEAAIREVKEETGGEVSSIWLVGQYKVYDKEDQFFSKNIYISEIAHLDQSQISGEDTNGAICFPIHIQPTEQQGFSPLVTDGVFALVRDSVLIENGAKQA